MDAYVDEFTSDDWDYEATDRAFRACLRTDERWPAISDLRDVIVNEQASFPTAQEAWLEVTRQISEVHYFGVPKFSSSVVAAAVEAIGWRRLCLREENDGTVFAQFRDTFTALANRARDDVRFGGLGLALPPRLDRPERALPAGELPALEEPKGPGPLKLGDLLATRRSAFLARRAEQVTKDGAG